MVTINIGCANDTYGDERIDIVKTNTTTRVCDLNKQLPFEDDSFDIVYSRSVIEHMGNPLDFIKELKRIVKKDGKIIIITDSANYINIGESIAGYRDEISGFEDDRHYAIYYPGHLKNLFEIAGVKVLDYGYKDYIKYPQEEESHSTKLQTWKGKLIRKILMPITKKGYPMIYIEGSK